MRLRLPVEKPFCNAFLRQGRAINLTRDASIRPRKLLSARGYTPPSASESGRSRCTNAAGRVLGWTAREYSQLADAEQRTRRKQAADNRSGQQPPKSEYPTKMKKKGRNLVPESQAFQTPFIQARKRERPAVPFVVVRNPLLRKNSVEGRLLEVKSDPNKIQPKFFSFFKSLVHLVE